MSKKSFILSFVAASMLFFACNNEADLVLDQEFGAVIENPAIFDDETFVSLEQATEVANAFFKGETTLKSFSSQRAIVSAETVRGDSEKPLMYVMNYKDGGFIIVGATRNYYPVLAYSEDNSFEFTDDMGPVEIWLDDTKEAIRTSDTLDDSTKYSMRTDWNRYEATGFITPTTSTLRRYDPLMDAAMNDRCSYIMNQYGLYGWDAFYSLSDAKDVIGSTDWSSLCSYANIIGSPLDYTLIGVRNVYVPALVGPLVTTQWHQEPPYNGLCGGCIYAGCTAIAMAQIMRYHQYPSSINWSLIPASGTPLSPLATQQLIRSVGDAIGLNYTTCDVGADHNQVRNAFQSYGYTATVKDHNVIDVRNDILNFKRPIAMCGFIISSGGGGHMWVCAGVNYPQYGVEYFVEFINPSNYTFSSQGYPSLSNPKTSLTQSALYFYMNWGWSDVNLNGWFVSTNVSTYKGNYQYARKNIYVHP